LLDVDVREFALWERKARVENARKQVTALGVARLAMHGDESYVRQVQNLADQIELWERPAWTDEEVKANWDGRMSELREVLKKVKRG
jgi:hypothetical protein